MGTNESLLARRRDAVPLGIGHACPVFADKAQNAEIWDVEGRRYIDFAAGIAVLNVGHRHPKVMAAVSKQLERFTHTSFQVAPYEPYIELCERLNEIAPFSGKAKTLLVNSGAEAVENAVKLARAATGRSAVVAFSGGFHGRTIATLALTGKVAPYKQGFGPTFPDVFHAPFPVPSEKVSVEDSIKHLRSIFKYQVDASRVAAIIIEPVQGEGGFYQAPTELLKEIRRICDEYGILLIADEVQTGFARTGRMFGIQHSGVEPDLVTVAKAVAGGFPLAGVIGRHQIMDKLGVGGLGSTYGGHPISCAAALATLDVIDDEKLVERANVIGARAVDRIIEISKRNDSLPIENIRGVGAMIAFDIVEDVDRARPDKETTQRVVSTALSNGLFLLTCGLHGNSIRLLMPITIQDSILDEGLNILASSLTRT
ncbi:4-aminobutyrate--2-oxoglutarate transaminase [Bradyrhizobium sp. KB893862 SZCCT0404]|uniref:4-aminobutyrate--2-oxoglutarate transaminase n=1 Tax=Bradyrhizobium sp. KB893862 SZCCT0404 TaxID=2807672 RepID=UPI001BA90CB3|nr:4-aminobutyrate--2-oxoglutarate transaminase [Bradyrhizobium sp. KB893862 SZCCT0404]MBR1177152.1 4-aminobutyrate--2-oxoglutarate transaminase [Bradyrhizobium sp. KB893862 SZCCT0404]